MKKRYWIIIVIVLLVIGGAAYIFLKKEKVKAYEWRTSKIERGDVKIIVTATGTLSADTTVQVGTQVSGVISKIFVDFNSVVRKGQVIAIIDTTFLAAAVVDAQATLYRNTVQVDLTKRNFDRTKQLFDEKVMAQADYDQAYSDYQTAIAGSRSAKAALDRAKINLRYATIIAPVSGVVVSRNVDVGQTVAASFNTPTLFTIANDLTKMQVQASVDEADIGKIQQGQDVTFTVDAYEDRTFEGKVGQIRLQPTILQNVVNYTVIINVPNPDMKLLPGMTANLTVNIQEADSVLKIPASALHFNPPQDFLEKMQKELPDSIRKKMEHWMQPRGQKTGQETAVRTESTGGAGASGQVSGGNAAGRQGGFSGARRTGGASPGGMQAAQGQSWKKEKRSMGFIWVKKGDKLFPERVRLGLSDGSFTEVNGRDLKEGDEVVTGVMNLQAGSQQTQQRSPFQPQMGPGRGGR
jgi:HlyD family secretion protein